MKNIFRHKIKELINILFLVVTLFGCTQNPDLWDVTSNKQVISDYVLSNPDQFSEFGKLLESTGLNDQLSVRGPYTLFLPNNEAMIKFYTENSTTYEQLANKDKIKLVYNHLVANEIKTGDIGLGALRDTNSIGDYLVTEFQGSDIIINKQSKIIKRDIPVANGYIQLIDRVIDPVILSVFDKLAADPNYSLFTEGLNRTGLKDTLQKINFPFGKKVTRTRFTILAVPNAIYNNHGIRTIDDLILQYTNSPDSITFLENGFYRYMEYHCLGGTYYLSDFTTRLYPILSSDNNVSVTIDTDYKLNYDSENLLYTGFDIASSDIPAKNGAIHSITDLLPVTQPDPSILTFYCTDYFDLKQGDYYRKYYMKWYDGQNTFSKIKWKGDYLQYYYKNNDDCLNMNGFWWCEITTPKIMKGHYNLTSNLWSGNVDYEVYVDGVYSATIKKTDPNKTTSWGEFVWDKTEEHKIKVVNITWGLLFWNSVIFTPIK
ncbi:MAG: fasciclin domain-containing protein [Prolixibacteraceae bacterium]|nr:fasciclin domain-containing protein [Prolixibacteraceae bacterium]